VTRRTEPKAIHRAPPVIAAGIRPRITGTTAIDVRVHIDERGRVVSAAPVAKPHQGLNAYLADSAVQAARLWRFEPARENGKAVPGTQTIHFVFQK
jgi:TonB family protein